MKRTFLALLAVALIAPAAHAQGPIRRAGQNIRRNVEDAVVRGQINAQERDLLARVYQRIQWDKPLSGSTLQLEVRPDAMVVLRGSVANEAAKARAVDLVENTVGVTGVVDELAIVKNVRVIPASPARVIESTPAPEVIEVAPTARVIEVAPKAKVIEVAPAPEAVETKVIVKP